MEIDKSKLKLGIWYEDESGNLIKPEDIWHVKHQKERERTIPAFRYK